MSWLGAQLGRVLSSAVPLALRGSLNFTGGLQAVRNVPSSRVDVSLAQWLDLVSLGYQERSSSRTTSISSTSVWYDLQVVNPTPSGDVCNPDYFGGLGFTAGISWEGPGTATMIALASVTLSVASSKTIGLRWALNDVEIVGTERKRVSYGNIHMSLLALTPVVNGDTLTVQVRNHTDGSDVTSDGYAAAYFALGGLD
jgi:hypothetical protein